MWVFFVGDRVYRGYCWREWCELAIRWYGGMRCVRDVSRVCLVLHKGLCPRRCSPFSNFVLRSGVILVACFAFEVTRNYNKR